jgi:hypothetical protein
MPTWKKAMNLKPCPFCGGEARHSKENIAESIFCTSEECNLGFIKLEEKDACVITRWNTRVESKKIKSLKDYISKLVNKRN